MRITLSDISIKYKIIGIIMLTSAIVLFLASASFFTNDLISFRRSLVDDLSTTAGLVGTNSMAALTFNDKKAAEETLAALTAEPNIISVGLYTPDGRKFAEYLRAEVKEATSCVTCHQSKNLPDIDPANTMKGELLSPVHLKKSYSFGDNNLVLLQPIILEGETIGTVCIQSDLQELRSRQVSYVGICVLVMALSIFASYMLSSRFQRVISKPILNLAKTTKVISEEKKYSVRAEKQSNDELGTLIDGFNEMLKQIQERDIKLEQHRDQLEKEVAQRTAELSETNQNLEQAMVKIKERTIELEAANKKLKELDQLKTNFLSTVSHELRTPLTSIKAFSEILLDNQGEDLETQMKFLNIINDESERLARLMKGDKNSTLQSERVNWALPDSERPLLLSFIFPLSTPDTRRSINFCNAGISFICIADRFASISIWRSVDFFGRSALPSMVPAYALPRNENVMLGLKSVSILGMIVISFASIMEALR